MTRRDYPFATGDGGRYPERLALIVWTLSGLER